MKNWLGEHVKVKRAALSLNTVCNHMQGASTRDFILIGSWMDDTGSERRVQEVQKDFETPPQ